MKKLIFSALALTLFSNTYAFSGLGDGNAGYPYLIETCAHLQEIEDEQGADYAITQDIDCNGFDFDAITSFSGTLNGHGWTISDLTIDEAVNAGLFLSMSGTVKNLTLDNADITGNDYTGAIAASLAGTIQDVIVTNSLIEGNTYTVGGITASMGTGDLVERVQVTNTTITGDADNMGGIAGIISGSAIIREAYTKATITGDQDVGGIVGAMLHDAVIENSGSRSTVTSNGIGGNGSVGGAIGAMLHDSIVLYSYHGEGTITANNGIDGGGFVGDMAHNSAAVAPAYHDQITCTGCNNTIGTTDIDDLADHTYLEGFGWDFTGEDSPWVDSGLDEDFPQIRVHAQRFLTPTTGIAYPSVDTTPSFTFNSTNAGSLFSYGGSCAGGDEFPASGSNTITFQELAPGTYTDCTIQMITLAVEGDNVNSNVLEVPPFTVVDTSLTGSGTVSAPYQVNDCYKLQSIQNDITANYKLTQSIDCSETSLWNFGEGYDPIGDNTTKFTGSLDGQNFSISNLFFDRPDIATGSGLFGAIENATIKNIRLKDVNLTGKNSLGAIAGTSWSGTIQDVYVSGDLVGEVLTAGVVANNYGDVLRAQVNANISNEDGAVGGIVGYQSLGGSLKEAFSEGNFTVTGVEEGTIGGILAIAFAPSVTQDVASHATISGGNFVGGIAGAVVEVPTFQRGYFAGSITGTVENIGGVYGSKYEESVINSMYYDENITCTGCDNTEGSVDLNELTPEFLEPRSWDFSGSNAIWRKIENDIFPRLTFIVGLGTDIVSNITKQATRSDSGSGKGGTIRWTGMSRDDLLSFGGKVTKHNFEEAYEKSKQQVAQMNEGVAPTQKYMVNRWGKHVFAGYLGGRVALDRFKHRFQNIVRFGSGSLTKGRGIERQEEQLMLASAPENIEDIIVREPKNEGWADEYQLAKDRFQKPVQDDNLFASAPVAQEKVALETDQVETHKNQRNYYRKKGIVDRSRDTSMVTPSRMDATKDMDTIQIRIGGKAVPMSNYLKGSQSSLFGSPQQRSEQGAYFWMFIIGAFIIAGVGASYLFKRK